jgi:hypothetical protein
VIPLKSGAPTDLFRYDPSSPLRFAVVEQEPRGELVLARVRYDNGVDGLASALAVRPARASKMRGAAGVVLAHGGFEGGKHLFLDQALELGACGFVVLVADTTFPRSGDAQVVESARCTAVVTHRRSLDVMHRVYEVPRAGFFGHSRGGFEGAILSALEPRLQAIVLAAIGSPSRERRDAGRRDARMAEYFDAVFSLDTARYVAAPGERRLFVQHGRNDATVSVAEGWAMFQAAAEPKRWKEYECGHEVDGFPPARQDRISFFQRELCKAT